MLKTFSAIAVFMAPAFFLTITLSAFNLWMGADKGNPKIIAQIIFCICATGTFLLFLNLKKEFEKFLNK